MLPNNHKEAVYLIKPCGILHVFKKRFDNFVAFSLENGDIDGMVLKPQEYKTTALANVPPWFQGPLQQFE